MLLSSLYDDLTFRRMYGQCPASLSGHHATIGGLLQHTVEVTTLARVMAHQRGADAELLTVGAMLHDVGKLDAYQWESIFAMTSRGALHGHVMLGALRVMEVASRLELPLERETLDQVLHLMLSHHGKPEWGAAVEPMTLEAEILHWADNASAQAERLARLIEAPELYDEGERISRPVRALGGRRLYRKTSPPN